MIALIPYYILRYEHFLKSNSTDKEITEALLKDMRIIADKLEVRYKNEESVYVDMVNLTLQICTYIIPDDNQLKRKVGDIMGGKILKLQSEILKEEGRKELIVQMLAKNSPEEVAAFTGISLEEVKAVEKSLLVNS